MKRSTYLAARASNIASRFIRAAGLCFILVFQPARFEEMLKENNAREVAYEQGMSHEERQRRIQYADEQKHKRYVLVRRALVQSALVVVGAVGLGWLIGSILEDIWGCALAAINNALQIVGASVLLWGTLFVRGWDIQTIGGQSLTERVNRWIYLALSFTGTAVFFLRNILGAVRMIPPQLGSPERPPESSEMATEGASHTRDPAGRVAPQLRTLTGLCPAVCTFGEHFLLLVADDLRTLSGHGR